MNVPVCFYLLFVDIWVVSTAAVDVPVQILRPACFLCLESVPRSTAAYSLVRQTVFQQVRTVLHSCLQCTRVPVAPYLHQFLLCCLKTLFDYSNGCEMVSAPGFNAHFPSNYVGLCFMCLLALDMIFGKCPF